MSASPMPTLAAGRLHVEVGDHAEAARRRPARRGGRRRSPGSCRRACRRARGGPDDASLLLEPRSVRSLAAQGAGPHLTALLGALLDDGLRGELRPGAVGRRPSPPRQASSAISRPGAARPWTGSSCGRGWRLRRAAHGLELGIGQAGEAVHHVRGGQAVVVRDGERADVDPRARGAAGTAGSGADGRLGGGDRRRRRRRCRRHHRGLGSGRPAERARIRDRPGPAAGRRASGLARALGDGELADHLGHRDLALALLDELREEAGSLEQQADRRVDEDLHRVVEGLLGGGLLAVSWSLTGGNPVRRWCGRPGRRTARGGPPRRRRCRG